MKHPISREISGIGAVHFVPSRRAQRLSITLRPFQGIRVTVPIGISLAAAEKFVADKKNWIYNHLSRIKKWEAEYDETAAMLSRLDEARARSFLKDRIQKLAKQHGFSFHRLFIRTPKFRWGSCSAKNNISLSLKLVLLPPELRDYVIMHELVHTRIKNHSPEFWEELGKYVENPRELRKRLNEILF